MRTHTRTQDEFPGLIPLVRMYVNSVDMDVDTRCTVLNYLRYISKKASGMPDPQMLSYHSISYHKAEL